MGTASILAAMEPRPCPFCGEKLPDVEQAESDLVWQVACQSRYCGATGPGRATRQDAIFAWNVRIVTEAGEPI